MIKQILNKINVVIIGGGAVFLCWLLRPLVKIRFGTLYTSRIGHLGYNMDNYLSVRDDNSISIFTYDKKIANIKLFEYWKSISRIYFSRVARFPCTFLTRVFPSSPMLIGWKDELHPDGTLASNTKGNIIPETEQEDRLLSNIGLREGQYICLHNRDNAYLSTIGDDQNYHDFRDFEFNDYSSAINYISNLGLKSVRLGKVIKKEYDNSNNLFLSLTEKNRDDFLDLAVINRSLFFVGCNNGFSIIPRLYRKPQLMVNYIPFIISEFSTYSAKSIFIPKKLFDKNKERFLTFYEMTIFPYDIHYKGDIFADHGLKVINNSAEEIAAAVEEMYLRLTGGWVESKKQQLLQNKFWDSIKDAPYCKEIKDDLGILVSSRFLEMNSDLI